MTNNVGFYYMVVSGDSLAGLASKYKLPSWETIWNHSSNDALRRRHHNPSVIQPGEIIYIPAPYIPPVIPSGSIGNLIVHPIQIKSITFTNDYDGLLKNDSDWKKSGTPINEPKWDQAHSDPVVRYINTKTTLDITCEVKGIPQSNAINGTIESDCAGMGFLSHQGTIAINTGNITAHLQAQHPLPPVISKLNDLKLNWKIRASAGTIHAGTSIHDFYCIYGQPISSSPPVVEDGATTKRMETAVAWVAETLENEPVRIVKELFKRLPYYRLEFAQLPQSDQDYLNAHPRKKQELADAGFPKYFNMAIGGAWPLAQFEKYCAECQAIVRLIIGILHQIGFPGSLQRKYINANAPNHRITIIKDYGTSPSGPDSTKEYALVDAEVIVGNLYDKTSGVGFNNFEAYLKFSYTTSSGGNRIAWFGGGTGLKGDVDASDPHAVEQLEQRLIGVFWGIAEFENVSIDPRNWKFKITNVWKY